MTDPERTVTRRLSADGMHVIIVERWLDRQVVPPRWRSKNRRVRVKPLSPSDVAYFKQREAQS